MTRLFDRTGALTRMAGLGGLLLLVTAAATLHEPPAPRDPSAPAPAGDIAPVQPVPRPDSGRIQGLFPAFPGATVIPMGRLEANGSPMEMAYFETPSPAGVVLDFFAGEFRRRGHHVVTQPDGTGGGAINYYDARRGALVSVTAIGVGGEPARTLVFPSIIEAPEGIHLQARAPESLPRPPGAVTVLRVDDHNTGPSKGSITLTEVAHGTPQMLAGFYNEEFTARGYTRLEARAGKHGVQLLDFQRPGERISLTLTPVAKQGVPESLVTVVLEQTESSMEATP